MSGQILYWQHIKTVTITWSEDLIGTEQQHELFQGGQLFVAQNIVFLPMYIRCVCHCCPAHYITRTFVSQNGAATTFYSKATMTHTWQCRELWWESLEPRVTVLLSHLVTVPWHQNYRCHWSWVRSQKPNGHLTQRRHHVTITAVLANMTYFTEARADLCAFLECWLCVFTCFPPKTQTRVLNSLASAPLNVTGSSEIQSAGLKSCRLHTIQHVLYITASLTDTATG